MTWDDVGFWPARDLDVICKGFLFVRVGVGVGPSTLSCGCTHAGSHTKSGRTSHRSSRNSTTQPNQLEFTADSEKAMSVSTLKVPR
jgi:hypothetical protein